MLPRLPMLLALCFVLAGCATRPVPAFTGTINAPYTLSAGDRLRIIVFGQDNLSNIYQVDGGGRIAVPLIGSVQVAGMTTQQVSKIIEEKLRQGYIREPKVTVDIETYRPFFILGEVTNAGQFPYVHGMTAQTAAAIAGGFSPRAATHYAEITRVINGRPVTRIVPITYPVMPGDTIVIKERWF